MIDSTLILAVAAAMLVVAMAAGVLAVVAMLLGLHAGVRIRQGDTPIAPWASMQAFLEKYVRSREQTAARAAGASDAKEDPPAVKPQRKL